MKTKYCWMLIVCLIISMLTITSIAEDNSADSILFREIPWYSTEASVLNTMKSIYKGTKKADISVNCKINSMELDTVDLDTRVERGGDLVTYWDFSVAGYKANAFLQFMYTIKDDHIERNSDSAEFYMAQYRISWTDYQDMAKVFDDIKAKLANIYGEPFADSRWTCLWKATDGSMVGLEYYMSIELSYLAPDADNRLIALREIYENEVSEQEEKNRQQNSDNYDGL